MRKNHSWTWRSRISWSVAAVAFAFSSGAGTAAYAQASRSGLELAAEPLLQKAWGGTAYDLAADEGGGITGLSRLEFPTVQMEAGISLGLSMIHDGRRLWQVDTEISHSFAAVNGTMNDYDWTLSPGYPAVPWSYTYSQDSNTSWQVSVAFAWALASAGPVSVSLFGVGTYQYASHVDDSLTGWQYVWNTSLNAWDLYVISAHTPDILEYTLTTYSVGPGLLLDLDILPGLAIELRAAYTPVYASDRDDHKLRTKLSTAAGWGNGAYLDFRATYRLEHVFAHLTPYAALDGHYSYFSVSTQQTQFWYGNADASNGAPQGTTLTGVGHVITGSEFQVGIRIGILI